MPNHVTYEVVEGVAEITMNRAPVNAINMRLTREVIDAYKRAREDGTAHAVILTSALPEVFSAGLDLKLALCRAWQGGTVQRSFSSPATSWMPPKCSVSAWSARWCRAHR
jgi:enoyl-CoA hydratase/carnithine racemase